VLLGWAGFGAEQGDMTLCQLQRAFFAERSLLHTLETLKFRVVLGTV